MSRPWVYNEIVHGSRFGRWIVDGCRVKKGKGYYYLCRCDCGTKSLVLQNNLPSGKSKSCGCLNREASRERGLKRQGEKNPRWKGGRILNTKEYIRIHCPEHPSSDSNGYILEHRAVAERVLGRRLRGNECVHHVDEDRTNNANNNLVVCDWGLHQTIHKKTRRLQNEQFARNC